MNRRVRAQQLYARLGARGWIVVVAVIGTGAAAAASLNDVTGPEPWTAPPRLVIPAVDLEESAGFYRKRLGFRVVSVGDGEVVLRAGPMNIVLVPSKAGGPNAGSYMEYLVRPTMAVSARENDDPEAPLLRQSIDKTERLTDPAGVRSVKRASRARTLRVTIERLGGRLAGRSSSGSLTARETSFGVLFEPELSGLPPGLHSFHLHENPTCDGDQIDGVWVPGAAAGGHYDPDNAGFHGHPYGYGHLGDLPDIYVNHKGEARMPVLAPRLAFEDLAGHSLMIHAEGEHDPAQHAGMGGSPRMACGVIDSVPQDEKSGARSP